MGQPIPSPSSGACYADRVTTTTRIHCRIENPPEAPPRAVLTRDRRDGSVEERIVGLRGRLNLEEAAAVIGEESSEEVRRAIRAGLLRARRHGSRWVVTLQACLEYLRELADDVAYLEAHEGEPTIPAEEVYRSLRKK